jgi:hypothetical protein
MFIGSPQAPKISGPGLPPSHALTFPSALILCEGGHTSALFECRPYRLSPEGGITP